VIKLVRQQIDSEKKLVLDPYTSEWVPLSDMRGWELEKLKAHLKAHQEWREATNPPGLTQEEIMKRAPRGQQPPQGSATIFIRRNGGQSEAPIDEK
jgi:hypothetical protein